MKIYFITSKKEKNAPNQVLKDIISFLLENGHQIVLIYFKQTENDFFKFDKKYNNQIEMKKINYNFLSILNKRKYFNTKISFSSGIIADIINSFFFKSEQKMSTLHSTINKEYPIRWGLILGKLLSLIHFIFLKNFNKVFLVSNTQKKELNFVKYLNYKIIENGIDFNKFKDLQNNNNIKKKYNFPTNKKLLITIGNNDKVKQITKLKKNFIEANLNHAALIIISKDIKVNQIKDKVIVINDTNKINEIFSCTDIFISYSKVESFNLSLVETYAANNFYILSPIQRHLDFNKYFKNGRILEDLTSDSLKKCFNDISDKFEFKPDKYNLLDYYNIMDMKKKYLKEIIE